MSNFDPYYKWLGIPPQEQPPSHYRLLGLQVLEQNLEVIASAANRQMAYLQELSSGDDHIDEAQGLLGEVARARVCLLAAESKARYDAELVSTLDSLLEAEEATPENVAVPKFDSADRGAAAPRRSATRRSGGKKRGSTARRSGRRSPPTKNASRGAAREEEEVATPTGASSLQVKLAAAVIPGVVVVVIGIGIVWMVAGGDSSSKPAAKNDQENKVGSGASPGQGDNKDSLEAARNKNFGNQAENTASNRPPTPVVKPPKPDSGPEKSKLGKPSQPLAPAPTEEPDDEQSTLEQAEALLKSKGLEDEFNSKWELAELMAAYEQAKSNTGSSASTQQQGSADFEELLKQRIQQRQNELMRRVEALNQKGAAQDGQLYDVDFNEYHRSIGLLKGSGVPIAGVDDIAAIPFTEEENRIRQTLAAERPDLASPGEGAGSTTSGIDSAVIDLANILASTYATLQEDADVQAALKTMGGTLAEAPEVPEAARDAPEQPVSLPADNANAQDDVASAEEPASAEEDGETDAEETPQEPAASFAELKDQLTALEKETKLSLGAFNKGAKEYTKQKKDLVKRIKAGEALYARRAKQQDTIQYPEKKNDFGIETDKMVTKPLNELKMQLQNLTKPDATAFEDKLKRAKKLLEQIKATPEYAANQKSIAGLAETIAKYRKGFEVQQTKMAK